MFNTLYNAAATTLGCLSQAFSPNMVPMHATQVGVNTRIMESWKTEVEDNLCLMGDRPLKGALLSQELPNISPDSGPTALQLACERNDLTTVKLVMTSIRAKSVDTATYVNKTNEGTTPAIVTAINHRNPKLLAYLVSMGAQIVDPGSPKNAIEYEGRDLYEKALATGIPELAVPFVESKLTTRHKLSPEVNSICLQAQHRVLDHNGHNALHTSIVKSGEELDIILKQIGDVNLPTRDGVSPLMLACREGASQATLTQLLAAGAVDSEAWEQHADMLWKAKAYTSVKGKSFLEHACLKGDVNTVYYCLAAGTPIALLLDEKGNIKKGCRTTFKKAALARSKKYGGSFLIHMAAKRGDATLARHLLASSLKGQVLEKNDDGWSASALAMHSNCPSTKALLVEHIPASELNNVSSTRQKAYEANKTSAAGYTPLQDACEDGDLAEIERLIAAGADLNAANAKLGASPLESAIKTARNDFEAHAVALRFVNAGAKPDAGALARACVDGKTHTRNLLLEGGADWMAIVRSSYVTSDMLPKEIEGIPLPLLAAKAGRLDIIPKLMSEDVMKAKDGNGNTLIHLYVKELNQRIANGNQKNIESKVLKSPDGQFLNELLKKYQNTSAYATNHSGRLPQELTSYKGLQGMLHAAKPRLDLLVKNYGEDPEALVKLAQLCELSNASILAEELAPHIAQLYTSGQRDIFWVFSLGLDLKKNGVHIGAVRNAEGNPMLCSLALESEKEDDFFALIMHDLHSYTSQDLSKFFEDFFDRGADIDDLKSLVEAGANVNAPIDDLGNTPLHAACRRGNWDQVDVLLELGANRNAQNTFLDTPLDQVDRGYQVEVLQGMGFEEGFEIETRRPQQEANDRLIAAKLEREQYEQEELEAQAHTQAIIAEVAASNAAAAAAAVERDSDPQEAFVNAVRKNDSRAVIALYAHFPEIDLDQEVMADSGQTAMHHACAHWGTDAGKQMMETLFGLGASRNVVDNNPIHPRTPLDMITHERPGKDEFIEKLYQEHGMRTYQHLIDGEPLVDAIFRNPLV